MWFSNLLILKTHEDHIKIWYGEDSDVYTDGSCRKQCQTFTSGDMWCTWEPDALRTTSLMIQHDHGLTIFCATAVGYCWWRTFWMVTCEPQLHLAKFIVALFQKPESQNTRHWNDISEQQQNWKKLFWYMLGNIHLPSCRELDNKVDVLPCPCVKYEAEQDWILATEMCGGKTGGCITYCISLSYDVQKC